MIKEVETKVCTKCPEGHNIKPITEFYICKGDKIRSSCKKCDNAMSKLYKARNRKHISKYNQKYKKVHRKEISKYNHNYNKNNREAIQKRQTRTHQIRRLKDFNFFMLHGLRRQLYNFVKSKGERNEIVITIIGCNFKSLEKWFTYYLTIK